MVQRSTSDPTTVKSYISKLDGYRRRTALQPDDRLIVLRTFFRLYPEAHESTTSNERSLPVQARERTTRLCGRDTSTVSSIVTDWITTLKNQPHISDDDHLKSFSPLNRGKSTISYTPIDRDENTFLTTRNFVQKNDLIERKLHHMTYYLCKLLTVPALFKLIILVCMIEKIFKQH